MPYLKFIWFMLFTGWVLEHDDQQSRPWAMNLHTCTCTYRQEPQKVVKVMNCLREEIFRQNLMFLWPSCFNRYVRQILNFPDWLDIPFTFLGLTFFSWLFYLLGGRAISVIMVNPRWQSQTKSLGDQNMKQSDTAVRSRSQKKNKQTNKQEQRNCIVLPLYYVVQELLVYGVL